MALRKEEYHKSTEEKIIVGPGPADSDKGLGARQDEKGYYGAGADGSGFTSGEPGRE